MQLYDWQIECLERWRQNCYRGIVNVVTGAGKTVLALAAVRLLEEEAEGLKIKIIVPKLFLVSQWFHALRDILGATRKDIGIYAGTQKSGAEHKFMIYVINSARYSFSRHMLQENGGPVLIIADECHHYGAEENSKIFDFLRLIPSYPLCYTLGLSATPHCKNYREVLVPNLGREIYRFNFIQALEANIISRFSLFNISLPFSPWERAEYDEFSLKISIGLIKLKRLCPQLYSSGGGFFAQLQSIAKVHKKSDVRQLAQTVSYLMFQRKELVHLAGSRIDCVIELIGLLRGRPRIIIFSERIETADAIYKKMNGLFPGEAGLYHSGVHEDVRRITLRNFEDSQIRIIVSCKNLDEGLNVSETDVGIVVSSTSTERQRVQRLGRVLRKKADGRQASFYYLYIKDTIESEEIFSDIPEKLRDSIHIVDLNYDEQDRIFLNEHYEKLAEEVFADAVENLWQDDKLAELLRNIKIGSVAADWLMGEDECREKICACTTKREKNYYRAMLYIIQTAGRIPKISVPKIRRIK